ncbi:NAD(P)-dependent oxidoreductase [Xanthomonas rydalmerensis]|uniref:NAD(P)-dependent oxidoreductase n=1 Tax=Xanthomonas rydalmerensis TaxID=3046274 RepID=A0ABZ0JL07_9XANT|nr:NAD(P)-dependent oxidoreductase [Xanthomonas sp. DM-2023]WOS40466.1 NAD(P)-dependent oxidoreductase [Xanthomonas sp. DM-2023]WOS44650.1 NAD(P)-dependent oxidoreductase [Xanthomonas sp. DM-2023]WOS48830.1 NAD(P)-dependent oxidoreductase [Xanthomonas sp. DM-2023]WOS53010.1 NAD(P)-dependent oxidoreductase [Xanthomonas sp. DM-2023]WOS57194.1 NAD(P)-dependent oxidoreductase [Xanthomonas sp. DM-2023]
MKRVLVTGAAGMIGRRLVMALLQRGDAVAGLDDLSSGMALPEGLHVAAVADIRDTAAVAACLRTFRADAVVHLAAIHHIPTCERQRMHCLQVNVVGTESVLQAADDTDVRQVLIASSGAVYAWGEQALDEAGSPTEARDNYALSKLCNEGQLRLWCARGGGRRGRVARLFNSIAHDDPNAHLIPEVLAQLAADPAPAPLVQLGNLQPRRDYLHADDAAAGLLALLDDARAEPAYDVFNLCSGVEHSVGELVEEIGALLGRAPRVQVDPQRQRAHDRAHQLGNPAKAAAVLGWRTRWTLREALQRTLAPEQAADTRVPG